MVNPQAMIGDRGTWPLEISPYYHGKARLQSAGDELCGGAGRKPGDILRHIHNSDVVIVRKASTVCGRCES